MDTDHDRNSWDQKWSTHMRFRKSRLVSDVPSKCFKIFSPFFRSILWGNGFRIFTKGYKGMILKLSLKRNIRITDCKALSEVGVLKSDYGNNIFTLRFECFLWGSRWKVTNRLEFRIEMFYVRSAFSVRLQIG